MAIKLQPDFPTSLLKPVHRTFALIGHKRVVRRIPDAVKLPVPVISVGNITFGGTAKTPHVESIAKHYRTIGYSPGVVTRGYLGRIDRESRAPEIVSDGYCVLLDWSDAGDEACLIAETLIGNDERKGVPVAVGRDRIKASRILIEKCSCDLIIIDDGFQFTSMGRDVDLVLIDALAPFGWLGEKNGPLREPIDSIERADAVVITHAEAVSRRRIDWINTQFVKHMGYLPNMIESGTRIKSIRHLRESTDVPVESIAGARVVAFAGIGNPESFRHTLNMTGCELKDLLEFPDHHTFNPRDVENINRSAVSSGAEFVVTTAKDAVRLRGIDRPFAVSPLVIEIEVEPSSNEMFYEIIDTVLSSRN